MTEVVDAIESQIKEQWKQARYDEITDEAYEKLADAEGQLAYGKQQIADGRAEIAYNETKLADAREEIEDIGMTQWYVQDRSSLSGYANVKSDAASIEAIGTVFPIVFFIVAILISLTTITRMVEEDRGLI